MVIPGYRVERRYYNQYEQGDSGGPPSLRHFPIAVTRVFPDQQASQRHDRDDNKLEQDAPIRHTAPSISRASAAEVSSLAGPLCIAAAPASPIRFSAMIADDRTPGKPAPGCVPAPTKYRLSKSSERLCGLNHADCVSVGWNENAAPRWLLRSFSKWRGSI